MNGIRIALRLEFLRYLYKDYRSSGQVQKVVALYQRLSGLKDVHISMKQVEFSFRVK